MNKPLTEERATALQYVLNRLAESSSWRGLVWIAVAAGLIPVSSVDTATNYLITIMQGGAALVGIIGIAFPESNQWISKRLGYATVLVAEEKAAVPPAPPPGPVTKNERQSTETHS